MSILTSNYVKHALIMCLVLIVCLSLMEITNSTFESKSPFIAFSTMIAPLFVWWSGIRSRKKALKNTLTYKQGVTEGFKISLVFGLLSPFIFMSYYLLFNMDAVEYARGVYGLQNAGTSLVIAVDMLIQCISALVFGTVYGAIISIFLRTSKKK